LELAMLAWGLFFPFWLLAFVCDGILEFPGRSPLHSLIVLVLAIVVLVLVWFNFSPLVF